MLMKKALSILVLISLILILVFSLLFTWRPELIKVVEYQVPDANTYKAYPQTMVHPADTAFHFAKAAANRNDLDTLHVLDGQNHLIPFADYVKEGKISLFMVIRNDSIIYQKYAPGYSDTTLTTLFSVAKTMVSIMLGQAVEEGKIKSLDDPLLKYVPELKANPAFEHITMRNLFDMKSGLKFEDTNGSYIHAFLSDEARFYYTDDIKKELLKVTLDKTPGTVYKYESIDAFLLTWALEKATGEKISTYFQDNLWRKIGTEYAASWGLDHPNGLANTASRFQCTAIDLAKIGRLYLLGGQYNGHQIVPQEWVSQSVKLVKGEEPATAKGWQKTAHHALWWVPQQGVYGDYAAEGMLGQRLYMDPLTNTIIVQFAAKGAGDYPYRKISRYLSGLPFDYPKP